MRITATRVKGKELKPGDLFSTAGPLYWENIDSEPSIGEKVYIRTNRPLRPDQEDEEMYRVEVKEN